MYTGGSTLKVVAFFNQRQNVQESEVFDREDGQTHQL